MRLTCALTTMLLLVVLSCCACAFALDPSLDVSQYTPRVARSFDGTLWFRGQDGVSVIDPLHIPFNSAPPPVHVEPTTADHKSSDASGKRRPTPGFRQFHKAGSDG